MKRLLLALCLTACHNPTAPPDQPLPVQAVQCPPGTVYTLLTLTYHYHARPDSVAIIGFCAKRP